MNPEEMQAVIARLMPIIMVELWEHRFEHHCIQASALLASTLHRLGMRDARLLTVGVEARNLATGRGVILGRHAPIVPEGDWAGHLTVVVPGAYGEEHALLDPTIGQINSDDDGITIPPLCLRVPEAFAAGDRPHNFDINGVFLRYIAYPEDLTYNADEDCMTQPGLEGAIESTLNRFGED